jgi:capsular exopolysaccharide synthesis family protein
MSTQIATIQTGETFLPESERDYLSAVWRAFKRHAVAALLIFAFVMSMTIVALAVVTPHYSATATVMIEGRGAQVVRPDSVLPMPPIDQDTVSSEIQVLLSRGLVGSVVRELDLAHQPEFDANKPGWLRAAALDVLSLASRFMPQATVTRIRAAIEPPALTGQSYEDAVVNIAERNLSASAVGRSRAINIVFSSASPEIAQSFVNTLARRYIDNQKLLKLAATEDANRQITDKLASLQQAAAEAAQRAAAFRAESNLMEGRDSTLVRQQISETSTALTAATGERIAAESRLHEIERAAKNPALEASAQTLGSRVIQDLVIHEAKLAGEVAPLAQTLGGDNPRLEAGLAQMANIRSRIQSEAAKIAAGVRGDYASAVERENNVKAQLDELKGDMAEVQENEVHLGQLEQNAQAATNIYEVFLKRAKETSADGAVQVADARVISQATKPQRPYFPNVKTALPVGSVIALVLAFMSTLVMEARDRGIRSQSEAARLMGIPATGMIPKYSGYLDVDPYSMIGSAVSDLYMRVAVGRSATCIAIASALPHEGKTTIALCLARMAGRSGKKALLIDCDLRRSDLRARLSLPLGPGISDVLQGSADMSDVMLRDSVVPELSIIPCGESADNPAGLLSSGSMREILSELRQYFDLIVIDTAPVMAAPETMSLAMMADETLLLVKWSATPRATAVAAYRKLRNVGATVAGVVLTMVDLKRIAKYSAVDGVSYSKEVRRYYAREKRA